MTHYLYVIIVTKLWNKKYTIINPTHKSVEFFSSLHTKIAASLATEFCKTPNMVTVKIGELAFKKPLKAGHHLRIYGKINHIGNSSIEIYLEAKRYNLYSQEEVVVCDTTSTFVRVDDDGNPIPIDNSIKEQFIKNITL